MANPQIEDGHVDIANEIVEALARVNLSGREMRCLWVILRKTYGWHKKSDLISLSQFSEMTGLPRQVVCKVLKQLLSKRLIGVDKKDNSQINSYSFIKDFEQWEYCCRKRQLLSKKTITVVEKVNQVLSKKRHTKESITKETIQKKVSLTDEQFLSSLKEKFTWIDFDAVMVRMDAWLLAHPDRKKTRRFIVNWLNKIEKPMEVQYGTTGSDMDPVEKIRKIREASEAKRRASADASENRGSD
jgi:phage replication O-like protein O